MDKFVAQNGTSINDGSITSPWSLKRALETPGVVLPGTTLLIRGGYYIGPFISRLAGTPDKRIKVMPYDNGIVTLDAPNFTGTPPALGTLWKVAPSIIDHVSGGYTDYSGFIVRWSDPTRLKSGSLHDRYRPSGFDLHAPGLRVINNVIVDCGTGIGTWDANAGGLIYGNIILNCGWQDGGEQLGTGHAIYGQNKGATTLIKHNMHWGGYGYGPCHLYTDASEVWNFSVVENFSSHAGGHSDNAIYKPNYFIGGGNGVKNALFDGNIAFTPLEVEGFNYQMWIGNKRNPNIQFINNYSIGSKNGVGFANYDRLEYTNNKIYCNQRMIRIDNCNGLSLSGNKYFGSGQFKNDSSILPWTDWKNKFVESGSIYSVTPPDENWIIKRVNSYNPNRIHIAIANFKNLASIDLAMDGFASGDKYNIRVISDYFNPVVANATYTDRVSIPLVNLKTTFPIGSPNRIAPQNLFNMFLVEKISGSTSLPPVDTPIEPPIIPPTPVVPNPVDYKGLRTTYNVDGSVTVTRI